MSKTKADSAADNQIFSNILLIVMCLVLMTVPLAAGKGRIEPGQNTVPAGDGWIYSDGSPADVKEISISFNSPTFIYKHIRDEDVQARYFCLRSKHVLFRVYLNGQLLYEFFPEAPKICGRSYGSYIHCIPLPDFKGDALLAVEMESIYSDNSAYFSNMHIGDSGTYVRGVFTDNLPKTLISFLMFIFGAVMILISFMMKNYIRSSLSEIISLASFAIFSGIWTGSESLIPQIVTCSPYIIHFLNYISLIAMPYPAVTFVAGITKNRSSSFVSAVQAAVLINLAANIVFTMMDIVDYHELLTATHMVLFFSIFSAVLILIGGFINKERESSLYYVIGGSFLFISAMGLIDLIRYRVETENTDSGLFLRFGLLVAIVAMGLYTLKDLIHLTRLGRKAEKMKDLAYSDVLTGMFNRTAFMENERAIHENGEAGQLCFVQFDINDLKRANDVYGHSEGDRQIIAGANAIKESFGAIGKCYRTGGDEFVAILDCPINSPKIIYAEHRITELVDKYNTENDHPVKLQIAYGIAQYNGKDPVDAVKEADEKMYAMKKRMKSENGKPLKQS